MITANSLLMDAMFTILGNEDFLTLLTAFISIIGIMTAIIYGWKFTRQRIERSR